MAEPWLSKALYKRRLRSSVLASRFERRLARAQSKRQRKLIRLQEYERKRLLDQRIRDAKLRMKVSRYRWLSLKRQWRLNRWADSARKYGRHTTFVPHTLVSQEFDASGVMFNQYSETESFIVEKDEDRQGHSANPVHTLPGLPASKWRNPSNYSRMIASATYGEAVFDYKDSNGVTRFRESGRCLDVLSFNYGPHLAYGPYLRPDANLYARAVTECLLKLQDQKINIGENIATVKDTIRLLTSSATTLSQAIFYAKKGNWGKVGKLFGYHGKAFGVGKELSKRWLEYQFGWRPLVDDIHAAAKFIQDSVKTRAMLFSAVRTTKVRSVDYLPSSGWYHSGTTDSTLSCRVKLYAAIEDSVLHRLAEVGLIDPVGVLWELVPFSFIADWITPIGSLLSALHATEGLRFVGGSVTWRVVCKTTNQWRRPHVTSLVCNTFGENTTEIHAIFRNVFVDFPTPDIYTKSPFSTTHVLDAIALIGSAIKNIRVIKEPRKKRRKSSKI